MELKALQGIETCASAALSTTKNGGKQGAPDWPFPLVSLINTVLEDGDFEEVYFSYRNLDGQAYQPEVNQIQQLFAVALEPEACIKLRESVHPDNEQDTFHVDSLQRALSLLRATLHASGSERLLAALPRRAASVEGAVMRKASLADGAGGANGADGADGADDKDWSALERGGVRVSRCTDAWDIFAGRSLLSARSNHRNSPVSERGWQLLDIVLEAWEMEAQKMLIKYGKARHSPSFLSQFEEPPTGLPTDYKSVLDIVFQPFQTDQIDHLDREATATRLLELLADLVDAGKLDLTALTSQVSERLNDLDNSCFNDCICAFFTKHPSIKVRLLTRYLERYSAAVPSIADSAGGRSDTAENGLPLDSSPHRRIFTPSETSNRIQTSPIKSADKNHKHRSLLAKTEVRMDPLHMSPRMAISLLFSRRPRESSDEDSRPMKRIPRRALEQLGPPIRVGLSKSVINAELRFGAVKLELLRILVDSATVNGTLWAWSDTKYDGTLLKTLRAGRSELSQNGNKPTQIMDLEMTEDVVLETLA